MVFSILIVLASFGIGIALLYSSIGARLKSKAARNWPVAKGVVLTSEVVEDHIRSATGMANPTYIPEISYEYNTVGGKFTGNHLVFGRSSYAFITASEICEHFPVGAQVDVYYNPAKPSESVLVPKSHEGMRSIIPGIFFVLVGISVGIVMILYK